MCGIVGLWDASQELSSDELQATAKRMAKTLLHRGPDDGGTWVDTAAGLGLGHRRLAIVDLSPEGHQPMLSADGRFAIAFNGEIYNFLELRQQLEQLGHSFRGRSDTEVMLASFCQWGVEEAIRRFNGMFAFALWDREQRCLTLARDRMGEKPLYYGQVGRTLLFASELKAFQAYPQFQPQIDRDALALFLRHNYIPTPYSIYQGVKKLPPACLLMLQTPFQAGEAEPVAYWSAREAAEAGLANPFTGSATQAIAELDRRLRDAVRLRMMADVPLGAFLSGGIDSSTTVALMQAQSSQPVRTFSIGFHEAGYNEAQEAKAVAQHLGTNHTELYVTPEDAIAVIPKLPSLYDEPFADSSQIPTFLVSQMTRQHVTVSLSGDGGDELFAGYNRYALGKRLWQQLNWMPLPLRRFLAKLLTARSPQAWDRNFKQLAPILPASFKQRLPGDKLHKLADVLTISDPEVMYKSLVSHWQEPATVAIDAKEPPTALTDRQHWANLPRFTQRMMYLDSVSYLPDDILVKVDRASMGVSLEARVPFLDHHIVEFAWRIPLSLKIRDGKGKWLLRQLLHQYVPKSLVERPKMGFGVPIDEWLRSPLRDWAESLLNEHRLQQEGFFNPQPICQKWAEHLSGQRNWQYYLWDILMFQAWLEQVRQPH